MFWYVSCYLLRVCCHHSMPKPPSIHRLCNTGVNICHYIPNQVRSPFQCSICRSARGFRHAVMAAYPQEVTTHIPEHAWPGAYWNERARGLGATVATPVGSSAEENALCHSNDR